MHMYTLPTLAIFLVCLLTRNIALHVGGLGFLTASILQRYASRQKATGLGRLLSRVMQFMETPSLGEKDVTDIEVSH